MINKITKCEICVVCLQFALIDTSSLKPNKVLKAIVGWNRYQLYLIQ